MNKRATTDISLNTEVSDIIADCSDADLLVGLVRRGIESSQPMADGRVRLLVKLDPVPKRKRKRSRPRKVSVHPDAML